MARTEASAFGHHPIVSFGRHTDPVTHAIQEGNRLLVGEVCQFLAPHSRFLMPELPLMLLHLVGCRREL